MRYYAALNLIRCLRYRPGHTLLVAFVFFWMLVGAQDIINYQKNKPQEPSIEIQVHPYGSYGRGTEGHGEEGWTPMF